MTAPAADPSADPGAFLRALFDRAVEVADPMRSLATHLPPRPDGRVVVIGAGKASRALVRLSNGRVLTLRLGDRINGGTITDIGDSRITFVKGGQQQALSVLGGR